MNREEIFEKLTEVFADVFDDGDIVVFDDMTAADVDGWDSLSHIALISAIEYEFGIKFDMKAVQELKNVGAMADLIEGLTAE